MYKLIVALLILQFPLMLEAQNGFSILYVANINGTLENCKCGKQPLGGVDRLKTVIEQCRQRYHNLLVFNGGDYFNSYSFLALDNALLQALPLLHFDLFVPGDQEFVEGESFSISIRKAVGTSWFLSNAVKPAPNIKTFKNLGQQMNVLTYLSPNCFSFIKRPEYLTLNPAVPLLPDTNPDAFNLIIYHGSWDEACTLARHCPKLDLILMSHEQIAYTDSIGHTVIIGAGRDAEFAVLLQIGKSGRQWKIDCSRIALTESIPVDGEISSLIKTYKNSINREAK
jgi:2',3'-cyclic-nucleotide 2'-phosphodiesterase (5'-nucleotidase family)